MLVDQVIAHLKSVHRIDATISHRFAEGRNDGAALVIMGDGSERVLKIWTHRSLAWAKAASAALNQAIRTADWPSPRWTLVDSAGPNLTYSLQAVAPGYPVRNLTEPYARSLVEINRLQSGLAYRSPELIDYSKRVQDVLLRDSEGALGRLRRYSEAANHMVDLALSLADHSIPLPDEDLVHGDYNRANMLTNGQEIIAIVDLEVVGWGSRAVDLVEQLRQMVLVSDAESGQQLLRHEAEALVGETGFLTCFAFWAVTNTAWVIDVMPDVVDFRVDKLTSVMNTFRS